MPQEIISLHQEDPPAVSFMSEEIFGDSRTFQNALKCWIVFHSCRHGPMKNSSGTIALPGGSGRPDAFTVGIPKRKHS
jgi:hypothetical protein